MKKLIRLLGKITLVLVGILLAYGLIGTGLSLIPVNGTAASGNDVVIYIDHEGHGRTDAFFEGVGRYSPLFTCNTWANSALKSCGQKCCLWTALQQPIFRKYK